MNKKTFQFDPPETLHLEGLTGDGQKQITEHDVSELTIEKDRKVVHVNWKSEEGEDGSVMFMNHNIDINIDEVADWYFPPFDD